MSGNLPRYLFVITAVLLFAGMAASQISTVSDSEGNLVFKNSTGETVFKITSSGGLSLESEHIRNFYSDSCSGSNEVVKRVYANGSYECQTVPEDEGVENLSETLAAGNSANRTISLAENNITDLGYLKFESQISIGNQLTNASGTDSIAVGDEAVAPSNYSIGIGKSVETGGKRGVLIGKNALSDASGASTGGVAIGGGSKTDNNGVALGIDSNADYGDAISIGARADATNRAAIAVAVNSRASGSRSIALSDNADATGKQSIAIGYAANASAKRSIAIGRNSEASASNSLAFGYNSRTENTNEATFGNLDAEELDVNVTGNLTVHQKILGPAGENVTVGQDLKVEGDVYSVGADLAEVYSAEKDYSPGTVVKVSDVRKEVEATESRFDSAIGVVSTDPGQVLNYDEEGEMIALAGKVPVRVSERVEKGERVAAGRNGKAFSCDTEDVTEGLTPAASNAEIVEALRQVESNRECLTSSFGRALEDSSKGMVEVKLE